METIKNVKLILKESYRWRNRNLIEMDGFVEPKLTFSKIIKSNISPFFLSGLISLLLIKYINDDVAGFLIGSLSIFVSLFTSVLILVFDKYLTHQQSFKQIKNPNSNEVLGQKKFKNFSRQFIFISLESLIISLFLIILLGIPLIFKQEFTENIFEYHFVDFRIFSVKNCISFFINTFSFFTRVFILLLLYKFLKYLFYIFGALGAFLVGVFKNNISL